MTHQHVWMSGAVVALGAVALAVVAEETGALKVQGDAELFQGVPGVAAAALTSLAGGGFFESVERQRTGPVEVYLATWKAENRYHDATVSADGALIESNEQIDAGQVPPPVQRAAGGFYGPASDIRYLKKTIVVYSARATFQGHEHEIIVSPTGDTVDDGGAPAETRPADGAARSPSTAPAR